MRLRLSTRLGLGYGIAIGALVVVLALVFLLFQVSRRESAFVREQAMPNIDGANHLLLAVEEMENAEFHYFLTPGEDAAWRQAFDHSYADFQAWYDRLETLGRTGEERHLLTRLGHRMGSFVNVDERMRKLLDAGRVAEANALNRDESVAAAEAVRQLGRRFRELNQEAILVAQHREDRFAAWTERLGFAAALFGLALALVSWWRTSRMLARPLARLGGALEQVAHGSFEPLTPAPEVAKTTDIEALYEGFNRMALRLATVTTDLNQANATLETQVAERTEDLRGANTRLEANVEELRALDQLKSNFMGIVSHELLTPINFITGYGSALEDGLMGPLTPEQARAVTKVMEGAGRLTRMVRNVLEFTQIESGALRVDLAPTEPQPAAEAAAAAVRPQVEAKGQTLELDLAPGLRPVVADAARLEQLLYELLDNASKFTAERGKLRMSVRASTGGVTFEVADTGIGIPPEGRAELFKSFHQADFTTTRRYGGLGLGLAIASHLVARMGGSLALSSQLGAGSTFRFELPAAEKQAING